MRSFPQAIKTYVYWNKGKPLKIIDAKPKKHSYPDHKYVLVRSTARQSTLDGSGGPPETTDKIYSRIESTGQNNGRWNPLKGKGLIPKFKLNVDNLKACADNPENAWGSSITGTLEQVNAQTRQQYEDLYEAVGVDPTSFDSMRKANLKVNGASLLFRYMRSFRT